MDKSLFNRVVQQLLPEMGNATERRALIESALYGSPVLLKIQWDGASLPFTVHLVLLLDSYGEIEPGKPAVIALLEELIPQVGHEKQDSVIQLIEDCLPPPKRGQTKMALDNAVLIGFLIEIGRWAKSELSERWTLRRKEQELRLDETTEAQIEATAPKLLDELISDKGQAHVTRTLERIERKRDLIEGWQDALVADKKQRQLGDMSEAVLQAKERDYTTKIKNTLREIEEDLHSLGFDVNKT